MDGFITNFVLTPANIDDREAVWELVYPFSPIIIMDDKGYIDKSFTSDLEVEKGIQSVSMKRSDSKDPYPKWLRQHIFEFRGQIEVTFSQLTEQLIINKVLEKSL